MKRNDITEMFTLGFEEVRAMYERLMPDNAEEAESLEREIRRLEYIYEATMWHLENSVATEQILESAEKVYNEEGI